mmetsp:Transcript_1407/g.3250  ORF Transcript_1407/g.3250 Transcript_1407/m.3250 type:complete len:357 (+) Transcript_1407:57-1127(+)
MLREFALRTCEDTFAGRLRLQPVIVEAEAELFKHSQSSPSPAHNQIDYSITKRSFGMTSSITLPQHLRVEDANTSSNPYLLDQLSHCVQQESSYRADDYLGRWKDVAAVSKEERSAMCSWGFDIVEACSIDKEVAVIGISYLDRFMSVPCPRTRACLLSRREFQLAFIACFIIALKGRGGLSVAPEFICETICQGLYSQREIVAIEQDVLCALQWRLSGASPHEFIEGLCELLPAECSSSAKRTIVKVAKSNSEKLMGNYRLALQRPSRIAYAALVSAAEKISPRAFDPLDQMEWIEEIELILRLENARNTYANSFAPGHTKPQRNPAQLSLDTNDRGLDDSGYFDLDISSRSVAR